MYGVVTLLPFGVRGTRKMKGLEAGTLNMLSAGEMGL